MPQRQLVMILIVEHIDKVSIKGMNFLDLGEGLEDVGELVVNALFTELDLPHVEGANTTNVVAGVNYSGSLALGLGEDDVDEVLGGRDGLYALEVVVHDC